VAARAEPWDLLVSAWHLREPLDAFPAPAGALALAGPEQDGEELDVLAGRYREVGDAVARAERPLVLAGDCLTSLGIVAGLQRRRRDVSVIWLDAHGDFNTPAISVSGYLAGMSLALLTGRGPAPIYERIGLRPVGDERVVLIDARDLDPAEQDLLEASGLRRVAAEPDAVRSAVAELGSRDVYLHVDVDMIDGEDVPGLRWGTSPGPSFAVAESCLAQIAAVAPPLATCIACPWTPERIGEEPARGAIARLAAAAGAELRWS
jgi:arginase